MSSKIHPTTVATIVLTHSQRRALAGSLLSRKARAHWATLMRLGLVLRTKHWNRGKWRWCTAARARLIAEGST